MAIKIIKGYASNVKGAILNEIEKVIEKAPLYRARVGEFGKLKYGMTNCGKYGWLSTEGYTKINPFTDELWPEIPETIKTLMTKVGKHYYPDFRLETVLINVYTVDLNNPSKPILGFHQDTSERNKEAPIISLSFGSGTFIVGGQVDSSGKIPKSQLAKLNKTLTTSITLGDGDLLIMYGDERMCFHAAGEVIGEKRINLTGRMVDPINESDKPLIISLLGLSTIKTLTDSLKTEVEKVMVYRQQTNRKLPSELLTTNRPGFDKLVSSYLISRKYPSTFIYEIQDEKGKKYRYIGNIKETIHEILHQSDHLLAATNQSDYFMAETINYYKSIGKEPWIIQIPETDEDIYNPNPKPPSNEQPPKQFQPNPDRKPISLGNINVTNIKDSGTRGLSSTNWHNSTFSRVYIGRGGRQGIARSPLHNPYSIDVNQSRSQVIQLFRQYSWEQMQIGNGVFYETLKRIATQVAKGKNLELVCHCKPEDCHGDVIHRAVLWMIKEGKVPMIPDEPIFSPDRLHLGMVGLPYYGGFSTRIELEIETIIDNKHRQWFLKLNGKPAKNPVIHVRGVGGNISAPQRGFDGLIQRYLYRENYKDVVVHGTMPNPVPEGWVQSLEPFEPANFNYLFVYWDEADNELYNLIQSAGNKALIAYQRKPLVGNPSQPPEFKDTNRFSKYAASVPPGTYVAVVGSREWYKSTEWAKTNVTQFVNALPSNCILVSGGAKGVDTWAEEAAQSRGLRTLIHPARWIQIPRRLADGTIDPKWKPKLEPSDRTPEFSNERANAGPERNEVLVDECNSLYAFLYDDDSSGTKHAISYAALNRKLVHVFEQTPPPEPENFEVSGDFNLFYFDED